MSHSSSTSRTQSSRSSNKQSVGSAQLKTVRQSLTSSTAKSNLNASSTGHSTKVSTSSRTKTDKLATKPSDDSTTKKRKSREAGYSEKRGLSTIYVPKPATSKLNTKSTTEKTASRTRDKEKLRDAPGQTKPRMSSKERRKSRTLSPSEIRMLHSAIKRPDNVGPENRVAAKDKNSRGNVQAGLDEADYEYEDDFEVKMEQ